MDSEEFIGSLAGRIEWAYNGQYCFFLPNKLPFIVKTNDELLGKFFKSSILIGRLDGKVSQIPVHERNLVREAFMLKESTMSSAIEGTRSTMGDVYREDSGLKDKNRAMDNAEIRNYKQALQKGLKNVDLKGRIEDEDLFELHRILMEDARGQRIPAGSYRTGQVAIGSNFDTFDTAKYVPPIAEKVPSLMRNWINYVNTDFSNNLLKIALAHYQFEAIHPFQEGNGRMGRLLIMLMLYKEGFLHNPVLYLSEYFNKSRKGYIERLYEVSSKDAFYEWYDYFLDALNSQIESSISLIDDLEKYREGTTILSRRENDPKIIDVINLLFQNPFIRVKDVVNKLGVSAPTAAKTISKLESHGLLIEITGNTRGKVYFAKDILDMLER